MFVWSEYVTMPIGGGEMFAFTAGSTGAWIRSFGHGGGMAGGSGEWDLARIDTIVGGAPPVTFARYSNAASAPTATGLVLPTSFNALEVLRSWHYRLYYDEWRYHTVFGDRIGPGRALELAPGESIGAFLYTSIGGARKQPFDLEWTEEA